MQGLSLGAVSRIASDLIHEGVVEESLRCDADLVQTAHNSHADMNTNRRGRPQTGLRVRPAGHSFVGVHVQHGKAEVLAVDAACAMLASPRSHMLEPSSSLKDVCHQIGAMIAEYVLDASLKPAKVALSLHGRMIGGNGFCHTPDPGSVQDADVVGILQDSCGIESMLVDDLDSLLMYRGWFGNGHKSSRLAAVMIDRDVSFSICENGVLQGNGTRTGNVIGHIPLDATGPRCASGHRGCSQCLTCDSLAEEYSRIIGKVCGYDDLVSDAHAGIAQARRFIDRLGVRVGTLLATIATFALPEKLLVCGALAPLLNLNQDSVRSGINWYRHGDSSELHFEIVDTSSCVLARAAAAESIVRYLG
jgi:predicted NBD/HSP70 family sugar kinase